MKKKGLIISTIVMVVVLIASLTTATYAWFSTSSVTSIQGFNVSVASTNDVNIGFRKTAGFMTEGLSSAGFVSGTTVYTAGTDGQIGGYWGGASALNGLSNDLKHDINWGAQTKAIGIQVSDSEISTLSTSIAAYSDTNTLGAVLGHNNKTTPDTGYEYYSINATRFTDDKTALIEPTAAKANKNGEGTGDYVYMLLGVQPTKELAVNQLVIMVDMSASSLSTVGVIGSLHLAYRISANGAAPGAWTDVDIMGNNHYGTLKSAIETNITNGTASTPDYAKAYLDTYTDAESVPQASYAAFITGLTTDPTHIDQIELVIYMFGPDGDCINAGLGASCTINMYFVTTITEIAA